MAVTHIVLTDLVALAKEAITPAVVLMEIAYPEVVIWLIKRVWVPSVIGVGITLGLNGKLVMNVELTLLIAQIGIVAQKREL